jgi:hypothetical protein
MAIEHRTHALNPTKLHSCSSEHEVKRRGRQRASAVCSCMKLKDDAMRFSPCFAVALIAWSRYWLVPRA